MLDHSSLILSGPVMFQQADGHQQRDTVMASRPLCQNAVLNNPKVPVLVRMSMNGCSTNTTNTTIAGASTNVAHTCTSMTPAATYGMDARQVRAQFTSLTLQIYSM